MEGKCGSECLLKSVSNIDFNPIQFPEKQKGFLKDHGLVQYVLTVVRHYAERQATQKYS